MLWIVIAYGTSLRHENREASRKEADRIKKTCLRELAFPSGNLRLE